jgi:hypothetical protein
MSHKRRKLCAKHERLTKRCGECVRLNPPRYTPTDPAWLNGTSALPIPFYPPTVPTLQDEERDDR